MFDPARPVFIDETCTNTTGYAAALCVASGSSATRRMDIEITFVGGLRQRGMTAPFVLEGAINGPMLLAYVKQCLVPTLKRGEIVLMDQSADPQGRRRRGCKAADATLIYSSFAGTSTQSSWHSAN